MFTVCDDFKSCNSNLQPYSFAVERHAPEDNLRARVHDRCFCLGAVDNRFLLQSPPFRTGEVRMDFRITYPAVIAPAFLVLFGYDPRTRCGHALRFGFDVEDNVTVELVRIEPRATVPLQRIDGHSNTPIADQPPLQLCLKMQSQRLRGRIAGVEFAFDFCCPKGYLALERYSFIGELVIERFCFSTEDEFDTVSILPDTKVNVPLVNGGDIPYTLRWRIDRIEGEFYLRSVLDGGTRSRAVKREERAGQYVAEIDYMTSPYIGIGKPDGSAERLQLSMGENCFVDPNIFWDCQKEFFGDTELPIVNTHKLSPQLLDGEYEILFGYEKLQCSGYNSWSGHNEFRFTPSGILLYQGPAPDGRDILDVLSQPDKLALSFVPQDCYRREDVIWHIQNNHYFDVSEQPVFTLRMRTLRDTEFLSARAQLLNVYEDEILGEYGLSVRTADWSYGYRELCAQVTLPALAVSVYKIRFCVFYGDRPCCERTVTFEVYDKDTDQNPAIASGLPFCFSMPNEQKWLATNAFDLWSPVASCNSEHYITCITDTPLEAEVRQPWRMIRPFKREWFAWLTSRTCNEWQVEKHPDVVRHADYLNASYKEAFVDLGASCLYPIRQDHFNYGDFMRRDTIRLPLLHEFLNAHPDVAAKLDYRPGEPYTRAHAQQLMELSAADWVEFQNRAGLEMLREQNRELRALNPRFRRSLYGPISVYVTPTLSYHSVRAYGLEVDASLAEDVYTGFCVFEDYPASCAYQTYRGAFTAMTILLKCPGLRLYPEQYYSSRGGCIDGAVKHAHPPMGAYSLQPYQTLSHSYEFVFNTPQRTRDGYRYWNDYGFHRASYDTDYMEQVIRGWKYVVRNRPARPLGSVGILCEYDRAEDRILDGELGLYNRSESAHGLLYECLRESGVPGGFALDYGALETLTAAECDLLILPDLSHAPAAAVQQLRRLHREGVALLAVSGVDGLEDLFGVQPQRRFAAVDELCFERQREYVFPTQAELLYAPDGAQAVMTSAEGQPLVLSYGKNLHVNADPYAFGRDQLGCESGNSHFIVGKLARRVFTQLFRRLSEPPVMGENVAATLFETQDGRTVLLAMDYTPFDNAHHGTKTAVVDLHTPVSEIRCDRPVTVFRRGNIVRRISFDIEPRESVFIELR